MTRKSATLPPNQKSRTERDRERRTQRDLGAVIASREAEQRRAHRFITWLDSAMRARGIVEDVRLAHACGIAKSTITHWRALENVPSFDVCKTLARTLGVPPLVVAYYAGHISSDDLRIVARPSGEEVLVSGTLSDPTEWGAIPLPAPGAPSTHDAIARAKLAIQMVPVLADDAKWQIIGVLEALVAAAEIQERARHPHPDRVR